MNLSIGQLSAATSEGVRTLRYWSNRGLLPTQRAENGYRSYDGSAVSRVAFIRQTQALGFSLEGIARLLDIAGGSAQPCVQVQQALQQQLEQVRQQIQTLKALEAQLEAKLDWADHNPCEAGCRFLPA